MKRRMSWLLVSLAALLAFPAVASAAPQPFNVTFDEARLQLNNGVIDDKNPTTNTTLSGTIEDTTGDVTVPQSGVNIARFSTSSGGAPIIVEPQEAFTGNYDDATGEFSIGGNSDVRVPFSQTSGCLFEDVELDFTTDNAVASGAFEGTPFVDGLDGELGSIVTAWDTLPNATAYGTPPPGAPSCVTLSSLAQGPGGAQLGNDISLTPVAFQWDASRLQLNNGVFDELGNGPSTFEGTYDTDGGALDIPRENVNITRFTSTSGAPVIPQPQTDFTGNYDDESGDLTLGGTVNVFIAYTQTGDGCLFPNIPVNLSTDSDAPSGDFLGAPFENGLEGETGSAVAPIDGLPTVVTVGTLPPGAPPCEGVRAANDGPSALALGNEIVEPVVPPDPVVLTVDSRPANAKVKQGRAKTFRVNVTQDGAAGPTNARVCAKVPGGRRGLKLVGPRCKNAGDVYTEAGNVRFKVKAKRKTRPKTYTLRFTATAPSAESGSDTSRLKVQKKKRRRG